MNTFQRQGRSPPLTTTPDPFDIFHLYDRQVGIFCCVIRGEIIEWGSKKMYHQLLPATWGYQPCYVFIIINYYF